MKKKTIKPNPDMADLAAKISNDIAEGIDCGETRKVLRDAIDFWATVADAECRARARAESKLAIFRSAKGLMDVALAK